MPPIRPVSNLSKPSAPAGKVTPPPADPYATVAEVATAHVNLDATLSDGSNPTNRRILKDDLSADNEWLLMKLSSVQDPTDLNKIVKELIRRDKKGKEPYSKLLRQLIGTIHSNKSSKASRDALYILGMWKHRRALVIDLLRQEIDIPSSNEDFRILLINTIFNLGGKQAKTEIGKYIKVVSTRTEHKSSLSHAEQKLAELIYKESLVGRLATLGGYVVSLSKRLASPFVYLKKFLPGS